MPRRIPKSWNEVSEELRNLQDLISSHQSRFRDADCSDIADDLEKAIGLLIGAQGVADELSRGQRWQPPEGKIEKTHGDPDWQKGFQHLLGVRDACVEYEKSLGARNSDWSGMLSAVLFMRSRVALDAVAALVGWELNDDAATVIRTLFEIEFQLRAIKEDPEFVTQLVQRAQGHRVGRLKAYVKATVEGRDLPEGITQEGMDAQIREIRAFIKQHSSRKDPGLRYVTRTVYSILSDIAHVSPMGWCHYLREDASTGTFRLNPTSSLLPSKYLMSLAATTELNILDLVVGILNDARPAAVDHLRETDSEIICKIKAQGL